MERNGCENLVSRNPDRELPGLRNLGASRCIGPGTSPFEHSRISHGSCIIDLDLFTLFVDVSAYFDRFS